MTTHLRLFAGDFSRFYLTIAGNLTDILSFYLVNATQSNSLAMIASSTLRRCNVALTASRVIQDDVE